MPKRSRLLYFLLVIASIILGLSIRKFPDLFPSFIAIYAPDAIWAAMVFIGFAWIFVQRSSRDIFFISLCFCFLIEFSQLYKAPWIETIRATFIGGAILGHDLHWTDFIGYTVGTGIGYLAEHFYYRN